MGSIRSLRIEPKGQFPRLPGIRAHGDWELYVRLLGVSRLGNAQPEHSEQHKSRQASGRYRVGQGSACIYHGEKLFLWDLTEVRR